MLRMPSPAPAGEAAGNILYHRTRTSNGMRITRSAARQKRILLALSPVFQRRPARNRLRRAAAAASPMRLACQREA